jgi:hypothetical protein
MAPPWAYAYVSLRKVDDYFDEESSRDEVAPDDEISRNPSAQMMSIQGALGWIEGGPARKRADLPAVAPGLKISLLHRRRHTRSMQMQPLHAKAAAARRAAAAPSAPRQAGQIQRPAVAKGAPKDGRPGKP